MFKGLFYAIGVFYLMYEFYYLASPLERTRSNIRFSELTDENKGKKWDEYPEELKSKIKNRMLLIVLAIWPIIGLFTFQWVAFLAFIIFQYLIMGVVSIPFRKVVWARTTLGTIDAIISIVAIIFLIVNSYHLKIDLLKLLNL